MVQDHIRYDILAQDALRDVIRKVLSEVAATGYLPGEHHFFITFATEAPGVRISSALKEKYAEQMTIVIQHQFWDFKVTDTYFEIGLSFSDKPEKLHIPFSAVRGFYDPAVNFELEFDTTVQEEAEESDNQISRYPTNQEKSESAEIEPINKEAPSKKTKKAPSDKEAEVPKDDDKAASAEVVSLDSFRKKN